jgi:two-component system sensor histidine kinase RegB
VVPCVTSSACPAVLNLALQIAFNPMQRLEPGYAAALLALNIVELADLLFPHRRPAEPVFVPVPGPGA